jgi:hypothetical protein
MKKWLWIFILIPSICFAGSIQHYHSKIAKSRVASGESYDYTETAEGADANGCLDWAGGNGDYDDQASPLTGSDSISFTVDDSDETSVTAADEYWVAFEYKHTETPSGADTRLAFEQADDGNNCRLHINTSNQVQLWNTGGTTIGNFTITNNQLTWFKIRCKVGTGANAEAELWYSTDGSAWSQSGLSNNPSTNGNWTEQTAEIEIRGEDASGTAYFDDIRIHSSDITVVNTADTSCP